MTKENCKKCSELVPNSLSKIKVLSPFKGKIGESSIPIESHSCLISKLPISVQDFIDEKAKICQPDSIYVCDGTEEENKTLLNLLESDGWYLFKHVFCCHFIHLFNKDLFNFIKGFND